MSWSSAALWGLFVAVGIATFALRLSFIQAINRLRLPPLLERALRFVPPAVLAALIMPAFLYDSTPHSITFAPQRLIAGMAASLIAWRSRSVLLTLAMGMGILWLLHALI